MVLAEPVRTGHRDLRPGRRGPSTVQLSSGGVVGARPARRPLAHGSRPRACAAAPASADRSAADWATRCAWTMAATTPRAAPTRTRTPIMATASSVAEPRSRRRLTTTAPRRRRPPRRAARARASRPAGLPAPRTRPLTVTRTSPPPRLTAIRLPSRSHPQSARDRRCLVVAAGEGSGRLAGGVDGPHLGRPHREQPDQTERDGHQQRQHHRQLGRGRTRGRPRALGPAVIRLTRCRAGRARGRRAA